jgi:hypothetical protein
LNIEILEYSTGRVHEDGLKRGSVFFSLAIASDACGSRVIQYKKEKRSELSLVIMSGGHHGLIKKVAHLCPCGLHDDGISRPFLDSKMVESTCRMQCERVVFPR